MVSYISASYIYPIIGSPIKNGVVSLDADGTIVEVLTPEAASEKGEIHIKHYEG